VARRHAREAVVRWLYEHDLAESNPDDLVKRAEPGLDKESRAFAERLFRGVLAHQAELDAQLEDFATAWRVDRMSAVDRAILRCGLYELIYEPDVPTEVILSEAVELAGIYSSPEAKRFVNGVLGAAAKHVRAHVR
jgi:N utilization substance protein B